MTDLYSEESLEGRAAPKRDDSDYAASLRWQREKSSPVEHLFQYLETIVCWFKAPLALMLNKATIPKLDVFTLNMAPGVEIGVEDARDFFRRYEAVLSETTAVANEVKWKRITDNLDVIKANFDLQNGSPVPDEVISERLKKICTIHPEAALMPLAYAHCQGEDGTVPIDSDVDLDALFPAEGNVFLGASRPCCWPCFDLKVRLASERLIDGRIYFVFPGTHATILPCMPPLGVPESELAGIRDELFYILHRRICAPKLGRGLLHLLEDDEVDMLDFQPTWQLPDCGSASPPSVVYSYSYFHRTRSTGLSEA
ncbi:hypothetical protein FKP32DRAFT_1456364 [Trametes sanguinea]|nr:hypothetical protein FKP32DRAFT_1456364 [Trametes sanguinea]